MKYIRVDWHHDHPDEPTAIYSELDDRHWEVRKVEVFRSGELGFAGPDTSTETTGLSQEPMPALLEIAADPQFAPREISRDEFEEIWNRALQRRLP